VSPLAPRLHLPVPDNQPSEESGKPSGRRHRRLRRAAPLVATISHALALSCPSWCDQWRLLDATPVPCGASRETVRRSELAGWAGYGYDPSHSRWYWGLKLYVLACPDGLPVSWCLANPKDGERQVAEALLDQAAASRCCGRAWSSWPTRAWPAGPSPRWSPTWGSGWSDPTGPMSQLGSAT
jgi:hypothetical protein